MLSRSNVGIEFARRAGLWYPLANSAVAVSGSNDTNENTLATVTVPAGAMGANGVLRITALWSVTNNANAKTIRMRFSGAAGTVFYSQGLASLVSAHQMVLIRNRNSQSSQVGFAAAVAATFTTTTGSPTTASVDTSAATTLLFTVQKATGTDTMTLESYEVEVLYKA